MRVVQGELKLLSLKNERLPKVREAAMILNSMQYSAVRAQGSIVGLIVGGYDVGSGFSLYNLAYDGTVVPNEGYVTTGSGSIFVKSILDTEYKDNLTEKDALILLEKCFRVSFKNDNASGGGFVAKIVTKDGIKVFETKLSEIKFIEN